MSGSAGSGRERRRRGWSNALRRGGYAVLLWISHPLHAGASDPQGAGVEPVPRRATIDIRALPAEDPGQARSWRVDVSTSDPRAVPVLSPLVERLRSRRWKFNERELPNLRGGIGLDIDLPEAGNIHLNLLPRKDRAASGDGLRWKFSADEEQDIRQVWSVGGTLDRVRNGDGPGQLGEPKLAVTPQLILDVDALAGMSGDAKLTLQRAQWRDSRSGEDVGRVWQINVRWRF